MRVCSSDITSGPNAQALAVLRLFAMMLCVLVLHVSLDVPNVRLIGLGCGGARKLDEVLKGVRYEYLLFCIFDGRMPISRNTRRDIFVPVSVFLPKFYKSKFMH